MKTRIFLCLLASLLLISCDEHTRFYTDVDDVKVEIKIERFDQDLFTQDPQYLVDNYSDFLPIYTKNVLRLPNIQEMQRFVDDTAVIKVYKDVQEVYENTQSVEEELNIAFKYYKRYFPLAHIPRVLFHISGFNQSIVVTDDIVSASIDNFLGEDYYMYEQLAYQYQKVTMNPTNLPLDIVYSWVSVDLPIKVKENRLLDNLIYQGKLMYLMKVFFPERTEAEVLGYTSEQHEWCKAYEANIWGHILDSKQLFSSEQRMIKHYVDEAPFTSGFSKDSPGRMARYIGLQIIKSYATHQRDLSLSDLILESDSQEILHLSKYRP